MFNPLQTSVNSKYYEYYGDKYLYEFPAGSGNKLNLKQIANQLTKRILKIFEINDTGKFQFMPAISPAGRKNILKNIICFMNFFMEIPGRA